MGRVRRKIERGRYMKFKLFISYRQIIRLIKAETVFCVVQTSVSACCVCRISHSANIVLLIQFLPFFARSFLQQIVYLIKPFNHIGTQTGKQELTYFNSRIIRCFAKLHTSLGFFARLHSSRMLLSFTAHQDVLLEFIALGC